MRLEVLGFHFLGGPAPSCPDAADDNGKLEITDAVRILGFLFLGADPPELPGPSDCGLDSSHDELGCEAPGACP